MKFTNYILITLFCYSNMVFSQQISVDNTVPLEQLIVDNLGNSCVNISSISSSVNGSSVGLTSYAFFERAGSNFPFESGIMLSTGNAASAGNTLITDRLSEGSNAWGTDQDIETILGINNTVNATSIAFEFVSAYDVLQFNFLLASEEYEDDNACSSKDSFVFLIRESGTGSYQNIALIPGTTLPATISNIRNEINPVTCPAQNNQFLDSANLGDTNFEGRTKVLTASTTIIPNTTYDIKLIIADQTDGTFDSAVFIESGSFKTIDLGEDITTCSSAVLLDTEIGNPAATFEWYLDGSTAPIPSETESTLNATANGTYRVVVSLPFSSSTCSEEDVIDVVLNAEESISPISNYTICDDLSNGTGIEIFDLTTKNIELLNNNPFTSIPIITFHTSDANSRDISDVGITTTDNITNPTIWVRIDDEDSDCFGYTSFDLIVNPSPSITQPDPIILCDNNLEQDGFRSIDLSQRDAQITNNDNTLTVTYHLTSTGAINNTDLINNKENYVNRTAPDDTVFARVVDSNNCVNAPIPLSIKITTGPDIFLVEKQYLDACDKDYDGFATFNLNDVVNNIVGSLTDYTPTFYEDENDAVEGNNNFITNPTSYTNTTTDSDGLGVQSIYLRVEDNNPPNCASVVEFEIHTNLLLTGTLLEEFALCDTNEDSNDALNFALSTVETYISNDLPNPVTVEFYETPEERDDPDATPLPKSVSNPYPVTGSKTLYVQLNNGLCSDVGEITLRVNPILVFEPLDPVSYCDTDDDGIVQNIDLHLLDDIVTGGNTNFSVRYFPSAAAAEIGDEDDELNTIENTTPIVEVHARIEGNTFGITCYTVSTFNIEVLPAPTTTTPAPNPICDTTDGNPDGFSVFNLNTVIPAMISDPISDLNIQFYKTLDAANLGDATNANSDWISNDNNGWENFITDTQEIFVRIEKPKPDADCIPYAVESFYIYVYTEPIIDPDAKIFVCKDVGASDPFIKLEDYDEYILNGQTDKVVLYFEDALFQVPIPKDSNFTSFNGFIYIRVENESDSNNCVATAAIEVVISNNPIYDIDITSFFSVCSLDTAASAIFNLEDKASEIKAASPDANLLDITFHLSEDNAYAGIQDISDSTNYPGRENETLYVRLEKTDSKCAVIENMVLRVFQLPNITENLGFTVCDTLDDPYNDEAVFNLTTVFDPSALLTTNLIKIDTRFPDDIIINFFENQSDINANDGLDNSGAIPDIELSNYVSISKTIFIKVANTNTRCFNVISFALTVTPPPSFNIMNDAIPTCFSNSNSYDLTQVDNLLVNDVSNVNISYHESENGANDNNETHPNKIFNYTNIGDNIIWARIEDSTTLCYTTTSFILRVQPNPIANSASDLYYCDNNTNETDKVEFNLTDRDDVILGTQDPSLYSLTYYATPENARSKEEPLNNLHLGSHGESIIVRVENNDTKCYTTTQFNLNIKPLPVIPLENTIPLCNSNPTLINADTGFIGDTYEWSTGETTPEILVEPTDLIAGSLDLWVRVTRPYNTGNCENPHYFTVIESEEATLNFTTTVDFADPNSITVDVSGIGDYVFVLDDGEPQASNVFENVTFGVHIVTIRDLNGCEDVFTEVVVVDIPKFFTPNSDGFYDTWHIIGIDQIPGTVVYIYNRHGKLLKTLSHTSIGWDGTYNGQNMPSDDYWFLAKVIQNGEAFDLKGHFALKR